MARPSDHQQACISAPAVRCSTHWWWRSSQADRSSGGLALPTFHVQHSTLKGPCSASCAQHAHMPMCEFVGSVSHYCSVPSGSLYIIHTWLDACPVIPAEGIQTFARLSQHAVGFLKLCCDASMWCVPDASCAFCRVLLQRARQGFKQQQEKQHVPCLNPLQPAHLGVVDGELKLRHQAAISLGELLHTA